MPSAENPQNDFSAGEIDPAAKRDTKNPMVAAGARQAANFRILNTKGLQNRSGRKVFFKESDRVEKFLIAPGITYRIAFPSGNLSIYDNTGTRVFTEAGKPWTSATAKDVVWVLNDKSIYIAAAGMTPRILTWDGAVTWTAADFAEQVIGVQKRTLFLRIAPKGITLTPGGLTGSITLLFSANVLVAGMVGTRIRFNGRQITITAVTDGQHGQGTVNEPLISNSQRLSFTSSFGSFSVGQVVTEFPPAGPPTGVTGVITAVGGGTGNSPIDVTGGNFTNGNVVSIGGSPPASGPITVTFNSPLASVVWDQEVMNSFQGWPLSVFFDQQRLGFCNFPGVPKGIAWSAEGNPADFYPDAFAADGLATDCIFELVPGNRQVLYVIPGMDASEFVFCDTALFYIQITPANPLMPGSVGFNTISEDQCGQVQPQRAGEFIVYASGGVNQLMVVRIFGAYTRAYKTDSLTDLSAHLFTSIKAIAIMTASGTFAERYLFVLNADGSVICGKFTLDKNNELAGEVGFTPWTGSTGIVKWVASRGADILFTTSYTPNGIAAVSLVEELDDSRYLDASQLYNTQPSGLPIPGGKGPLWYIAGGSVDLMDGPLGTRMMGTYLVDANGFLIPQFNGGEDLTSVNLRVGQTWTATFEPFIPPVQGGQDVAQRMTKRRLKRFRVHAMNSSGFVIAKLWGGDVGPLLPAPGAIMTQRRIPAWFTGEDPTQPPLLREGAWAERPTGRFWDPRAAVIKDTPGPLTIVEIDSEITA